MELDSYNDLPIIVVGSGLAGLVSASKASMNYHNVIKILFVSQNIKDL